MGSRKVCFFDEEGQTGICIRENLHCTECDANPFPGKIIPEDRVLKVVKKMPEKVECCTCCKRLSDKLECPISHFGKNTRPIAEKTISYCGCNVYVKGEKLSFAVEVSDVNWSVINALDIQEFIQDGMIQRGIGFNNVRVIDRTISDSLKKS